MGLDGDMIDHFYSTIKSTFNKCHYPTIECVEPAIRAHSVQNGKVLSLLSREGHVIMITQNANNFENPPELEFRKISRHKATTFTGLCNSHDTELFKPIDTEPIDISSNEHLFLMAYRSLIREYHVNCETAVKLQSTYRALLAKGEINEHDTSFPMRVATNQLILAHTLFKYKSEWDLAYLHKAWGRVDHIALDLGPCPPTIAASGQYQTKRQVVAADYPSCIIINVYPQGNRCYAVYSYLSEHSDDAKPEICRIQEADGHYRKYLISKQILRHVENFVLSPVFFEHFSKEKIRAIVDYFGETMYCPDSDVESEHLYLFAE